MSLTSANNGWMTPNVKHKSAHAGTLSMRADNAEHASAATAASLEDNAKTSILTAWSMPSSDDAEVLDANKRILLQ